MDASTFFFIMRIKSFFRLHILGVFPPRLFVPPAFKFVNSRHTKNTFPYFPRATLRFYFDANYKKMWVGNDIETS